MAATVRTRPEKAAEQCALVTSQNKCPPIGNAVDLGSGVVRWGGEEARACIPTQRGHLFSVREEAGDQL